MRLKIFTTFALPTWLRHIDPVRSGLALSSHSDGGWCALEDKKFAGVLGDLGHDLQGRRASSHYPDSFVA
jgi:hypothetical protein